MSDKISVQRTTRQHSILVRLSEEELARIKGVASSCNGMRIAPFLREVALKAISNNILEVSGR
jgi:predicted DNA binding CopG/RHH family protein